MTFNFPEHDDSTITVNNDSHVTVNNQSVNAADASRLLKQLEDEARENVKQVVYDSIGDTKIEYGAMHVHTDHLQRAAKTAILFKLNGKQHQVNVTLNKDRYHGTEGLGESFMAALVKEIANELFNQAPRGDIAKLYNVVLTDN